MALRWGGGWSSEIRIMISRRQIRREADASFCASDIGLACAWALDPYWLSSARSCGHCCMVSRGDGALCNARAAPHGSRKYALKILCIASPESVTRPRFRVTITKFQFKTFENVKKTFFVTHDVSDSSETVTS